MSRLTSLFTQFAPGIVLGLFAGRVAGELWAILAGDTAVLLAAALSLLGIVGGVLLTHERPFSATWPLLFLFAYVVYPEANLTVALLAAALSLLVFWQDNGRLQHLYTFPPAPLFHTAAASRRPAAALCLHTRAGYSPRRQRRIPGHSSDTWRRPPARLPALYDAGSFDDPPAPRSDPRLSRQSLLRVHQRAGPDSRFRRNLFIDAARFGRDNGRPHPRGRHHLLVASHNR